LYISGKFIFYLKQNINGLDNRALAPINFSLTHAYPLHGCYSELRYCFICPDCFCRPGDMDSSCIWEWKSVQCLFWSWILPAESLFFHEISVLLLKKLCSFSPWNFYYKEKEKKRKKNTRNFRQWLDKNALPDPLRLHMCTSLLSYIHLQISTNLYNHGRTTTFIINDLLRQN